MKKRGKRIILTATSVCANYFIHHFIYSFKKHEVMIDLFTKMEIKISKVISFLRATASK